MGAGAGWRRNSLDSSPQTTTPAREPSARIAETVRPRRQHAAMGDDSGEPARDWRSVDREQLTRLLSSGLTPAHVGKLYGRSTDAVRLRARQWGLDCRALRA